MNIFSSFVLRSNGDDLWNRFQIGWWRALCEPKKKDKKKWKNEKMVNDPLADNFSLLLFLHLLILSLCSTKSTNGLALFVCRRVKFTLEFLESPPVASGQMTECFSRVKGQNKKPRRPCVAQDPAVFHAAQQRARVQEMVTTEKNITAEMRIFMFNRLF